MLRPFSNFGLNSDGHFHNAPFANFTSDPSEVCLRKKSGRTYRVLPGGHNFLGPNLLHFNKPSPMT